MIRFSITVGLLQFLSLSSMFFVYASFAAVVLRKPFYSTHIGFRRLK